MSATQCLQIHALVIFQVLKHGDVVKPNDLFSAKITLCFKSVFWDGHICPWSKHSDEPGKARRSGAWLCWDMGAGTLTVDLHSRPLRRRQILPSAIAVEVSVNFPVFLLSHLLQIGGSQSLSWECLLQTALLLFFTLCFPSRARLPVNTLLRLWPLRVHIALYDSTKRSTIDLEFNPRISNCVSRIWVCRRKKK